MSDERRNLHDSGAGIAGSDAAPDCEHAAERRQQLINPRCGYTRLRHQARYTQSLVPQRHHNESQITRAGLVELVHPPRRAAKVAGHVRRLDAKALAHTLDHRGNLSARDARLTGDTVGADRGAIGEYAYRERRVIPATPGRRSYELRTLAKDAA